MINFAFLLATSLWMALVAGTPREESPISESRMAKRFQGFALDCVYEGSVENATFEELLCLNEKRKAVSENIASTRALLSQFNTQLQSFVEDSVFDVRSFESQAHELDRNLSGIVSAVKIVGKYDRGISLQLKFSQHMFRVMTESIDILKYYKTLRTPGHNVVWSMIDLNIQLLTLYDVYGIPSYRSKDFIERVNLYAEYLRFLEQSIQNFTSLPFGMQQTLKKQRRRAQSALKILVAYLPRKGDY